MRYPRLDAAAALPQLLTELKAKSYLIVHLQPTAPVETLRCTALTWATFAGGSKPAVAYQAWLDNSALARVV